MELRSGKRVGPISQKLSASGPASLRTYIVAVYPRFNGLYYTAQYEDFNVRGENLLPSQRSNWKEQITRDLQRIVLTINSHHVAAPAATFTKYDAFTSSYGDECEYFPITVSVC